MNPDPPSPPASVVPAGDPGQSTREGRSMLAHPLAWIVLAISLAASVGGWFLARRHEEAAARKQFEEAASRIQMAISDRLSSYQDVLRGGLGLYAASGSVERAEWKAYVETVFTSQRFPGIEGLGFIARVPRDGLEAFLKATRADHAPGFQVKNPGPSDDLLITKYLEPEAAHAALIGTDLGADPQCRAVAERARDTGLPAISGPLDFPGAGAGAGSRLVMLAPVVRQGASPASLAERRASLEGWVYARFVADQLLDGILLEQAPVMRLQVFDLVEQGPETLIFDSQPAAGNEPNHRHPRVSVSHRIRVGQRAWLLRCASKPAFEASIPRGSEILVAASGGVISLLLFGISLSLSTTRARAVALSGELSVAFRRANAELQREQYLFSTLMGNIPDRIYFKDRQSRFMRVNKAMFARHGTTSAAGIIGKTDFDFFSDEHARQAFEDEQALIRDGRPVTKEEKETWSDGTVTWVLTTKMPLRDEAGNVVGTFGVSRDITDRKRAEEAMRQARDEAEEASRTKSQFLANMSHELRTPLNSVIGFAGILLKNKAGNLRPADLTFLERIQANGKHLLVLINEILDLSKIEARKVELRMAPVALDALVRETVAQQEGLVRERPVQLLADLPAVVAPVLADADKLRQVLINLIGNALKFTERGSVTLRVVTHPGDDQPLRIEVVDTGIGIPREHLGRIFQAFQQADASTARKYGGTGLGLTISQALCRLMGFRIEVTSEPGQGSTFSVILADGPTVPALAAPDKPEVKPASGLSAGQRPSALQGKLVLVIDDESDSRVLLTHLLQEFGCQVLAAGSGEVGLRMAREFRPQLITVDLLMPQMDGAAVIRALKADPRLRDIPLVVVSIVAEERRGSILGVVDILEKPVSRGELLAALQRNLPAPQAKILIVDDEEDARRILQSHLADEPVEIRTAANGREALAALETFAPDLVLLDLMMPVMDGGAFLDALRSDPRYQHLTVIVVTAKELTPAEKDHLRRQTLEVVKKTELSEEKFKQLLQRILKTRAESEPRKPAVTD